MNGWIIYAAIVTAALVVVFISHVSLLKAAKKGIKELSEQRDGYAALVAEFVKVSSGKTINDCIEKANEVNKNG